MSIIKTLNPVKEATALDFFIPLVRAGFAPKTEYSFPARQRPNRKGAKMNFSDYCALNGLPGPKWFIPLIIALILLAMAILAGVVRAEGLTASWYSVESCKREGTSGIMANGKELKDDELTAASWDYNFGTLLKIINLENNKSVIVEVCDRGPSKRLWAQGRRVDLSKGAFAKIANLEQGLVEVRIEVIK